jgi:hypothetical protein
MTSEPDLRGWSSQLGLTAAVAKLPFIFPSNYQPVPSSVPFLVCFII